VSQIKFCSSSSRMQGVRLYSVLSANAVSQIIFFGFLAGCSESDYIPVLSSRML